MSHRGGCQLETQQSCEAETFANANPENGGDVCDGLPVSASQGCPYTVCKWSGGESASERFRLTPLQQWLFTPELQRQSRGQRRI